MVPNVDNGKRNQIVKRNLILFLLIAVCMALMSCAKKPPSLDTKPCKKAKGYFQLSISYINADDPTGALEELLKGEKLCPHDPEIQNAIGLVYFAKERFDKSINHFELALQHDANYSDAYHNLGIVLLYLNRYDEAIDKFQKALGNDLYRNRANSLNALGWSYYKKSDYTQSEKYFQETLDHDRLYLPAYDNLAKVYIAFNRFEDAIQQLEKALDINPLFPEALLDLGICHLKLSRIAKENGEHERADILTGKAKECFKKVLEIDPLGKLGSQAQEFLNLLE